MSDNNNKKRKQDPDNDIGAPTDSGPLPDQTITHSYDLYFPQFTTSDAFTPQDKALLKQQALPNWLSNPITVPLDPPSQMCISHMPSLNPSILATCAKLNIKHLFPIQQALLPRLIKTNACMTTSMHPTMHHDMLVSAPTGSGKTLAYVIPIVNTLCTRTVVRLRALILVPTKELVKQVYDTFLSFTDALHLHVVMSCGGSAANRQHLSVSTVLSARVEDRALPSIGLPAQILANYPARHNYFPPSLHPLNAGISNADILITTPSRLLDHLANTSGFTLQHLQFLVLDEADRVLDSSGTSADLDWLGRVLESMHSSNLHGTGPVRTPSLLPDSFPGSGIHCLSQDLKLSLNTSACLCPRPLKLLFSATLTRNAEKLARMHLHDPILITGVHGSSNDQNSLKQLKYVLPATLHENMSLVKSIKDKPVALAQILHALSDSSTTPYSWISKMLAPVLGTTKDRTWRVLVFTKSIDSARQLAKVMDLAHAQQIWIKHISRELSSAARKSILMQFAAASHGVCVLVASDVLARGIDVAHVDLVINYDPPAYVSQYIHRVGRSARAGELGLAVTLLAVHQVKFFKALMAAKRGGHWMKDVSVVNVGLDPSVRRLLDDVYRSVGGCDVDLNVAEEEEEEDKENTYIDDEAHEEEVSGSTCLDQRPVLTVFESSDDDPA